MEPDHTILHLYLVLEHHIQSSTIMLPVSSGRTKAQAAQSVVYFVHWCRNVKVLKECIVFRPLKIPEKSQMKKVKLWTNKYISFSALIITNLCLFASSEPKCRCAKILWRIFPIWTSLQIAFIDVLRSCKVNIASTLIYLDLRMIIWTLLRIGLMLFSVSLSKISSKM